MANRIGEQSATGVGSKRTTTAPSWVGKRVGRFRLVAELGRGAMGRVFRGEDTLLHRQVALKVLPKFVRRGNKTITVERLISEARAAATLDHPNVVTVHEVNESGGVYYIAMELLEGGSLRDLIKAAGPMDYPRACLMCADAADGLAQAHALGIVHRDVKPANLMLTRSGRCKVVDFGLARMDDASDFAAAIPESVGTPQFIAPELLRGVPASAHSDLYSLGATLWFLLTGHPPFEARTEADLLRKHLEEPLPDLAALRPDLPPGLVQAVNKAMAKQPADRFESTAQFEKVLRVYTIAPESGTATSFGNLMSINEPTVPDPSYMPAPAAAPWRPTPVMLAAAGGGLVVLVGLLVLLLHVLQPSPTVSSNASQPPAGAAPRAADPAPSGADAPPQRADVAEAPPLAPLREDAKALSARAAQYARHGQFSQAAADYEKAIQIDPSDLWRWYYRGCLAAYMGDENAYRRTCKGMFQRFAASSDPTTRDRTAKTCCALENCGVDPKEILALAQTLPDDGGGNADFIAWFSMCKGMALYRTGQYQQAIDMLQRAHTPDLMPRSPTVLLVQAMAQWRAGQHAEAQSTLRQATQRLDSSLPKAGIDDLGTGIENWLMCQTLRRQAEMLVQH